jgi:DNA-binding transcriptional LysR family regulator
MREIHNIDLNLIRVFDAILNEKGVSRAADRLHLTQSAISHSLARLREIVGDQLFLRGPDGMHPTPRAVELARSFTPALHQIEQAILAPTFDAASSDIEFAISTSDYISTTIMPELMARVRQLAPAAQLWLRPLSEVNIPEGLDRGTIHVAIGVFGRTPSRFVSEPLFADRNVWLMRAGHPAAAGTFGPQALAAYPHLDILISGNIQAGAGGGATVDQGGLERAYISSNPRHLEEMLGAEGLTRKTGATVSHILAVPSLLARTEMIALVPLQFARRANRSLGLVWREPNYDAPPIKVSMLSHRTMGAHPSVAWLRRQIIECTAICYEGE